MRGNQRLINLWSIISKGKNDWKEFIFLMVLTLPVILPLFKPGMFVSDDAEWMVIRFSAFHQALRDGQFPVRWLGRLNHEYGYPVANFLYPGFMYLAEIPKILGFGFVDSIKIVLGFSLAGSALFAYLWLRCIFSRLPPLLGALFYLYAPYHLWDVYKRGSVGEVLALAIVPLILWMIEKKNLFFSSLGIGFLILSHNTLAILFLPLVFIYAILRKLITNYQLLITLFLGFGISAFFWVPAIFDLGYTRFFETQVASWQEHFADFGLIGWASILIIALAIFLQFNESIHRAKLWQFFLAISGITIVLSLSISKSVWQFLPANFIQFPFRLLSVAIVSLSFLSAIIMDKLNGMKKVVYGIIFLAAILISAASYIRPVAFFDKGEGFYATNEATTTVANEYMTVWAQKLPTDKPREKVEVVSGKGGITGVFANSKKISFDVNAKTNMELKINTLYFPGWMAKIDGVDTPVSFDNPEGLIVLSVPEGKHKIEVLWKETTLRKFSDMISAVSFIVLIIWQIKKFKNA